MRKDERRVERVLMQYSTYTIVGITQAMSRSDRAARAAYVAEMLRINPGWEQTHPTLGLVCITCGELGATQDWCNTCEVMGNHPYHDYPNIITPMCRPCIQADIKCPVCLVRPSDGPDDMSFMPPGLGADDVAMQIAGSF